jgi:hypothetical protein
MEDITQFVLTFSHQICPSIEQCCKLKQGTHSTIGECASEFVVLWEHKNARANFYTNEEFCALWTCVSFYILLSTIMLCTWEFDIGLCSTSSSKLSFFGLFYHLLFEQIVEATWVSRVTKLHWFSRSWGTRNGVNCKVVFIVPKIVCIFCVQVRELNLLRNSNVVSWDEIEQFWKLQGERTCTH